MYLLAREFAVLWELIIRPGYVLSKHALRDAHSAERKPMSDNAMKAFVSRVSKKITGSGASIRTLRGMGYLLEAAANARADAIVTYNLRDFKPALRFGLAVLNPEQTFARFHLNPIRI